MGIAIPTGLYLLFNYGTLKLNLGIPMATDIAFAFRNIPLLLGNRVPLSLGSILTTV
jgi:NhaA family Na+:H+ antiporter